MKPAHTIRKRIIRWDWTLGILGVLGMVLYFMYYPSQHFDSAIRHELTGAEAIERTKVFLDENGLPYEDLRPMATLRRSGSVLEDLQYTLGRREAVAFLKREEAGQLPGLFWQVQWVQAEGQGIDQQYRFQLTQSGELIDFDNDATAGGIRSEVHEQAVQYAMQQGEDGVEIVATVLDSLQLDHRFRMLMDSIRAQVGLSEWQTEFDEGESGSTPYARVLVGMARYHLDQSTFDASAFRVDSVWVPAERGLGTAGVRFVSSQPRHGFDTRIDVELALSGNLLDLDKDFELNDAVPAKTIWSEAKGAYAISMALYVLLIFIYGVAFFRRHGAGAIDIKGSLWDTLLLGLVAGFISMFAYAYPSITSGGLEFGWQVLIGLGMSVLFGTAGISLLVFVVSGVSNSIARESRRDRMASWRMVRARFALSKPVGRSILRGIGLGMVLIGVLMLFLILFPGARIAVWEDKMMYDWLAFPSLTSAFYYAWIGFVNLAIVLVCIGTFLHRRKLSNPWVVLILGLVFGLVQLWPEYFSPVPVALVFSVLIGGVLAAAYLFYDFLTAFIGLMVFRLIWFFSNSWAVPDSPLFADGVIVLFLLLTLGGIGYVFSRYGKHQREIPEYVPDYIKTLARQKRMERELEIAHDVQMSFLPQRMPEVEGVDMAAMCLAANEVGGDYYDVVQLGEDKLALVIGDVSGKGIQAAFYMTLVKGFIRTLCREVASPAEVLRRTNRLFLENAPRGTFISMIYGILDVRAGTLTFARAGHNPVILKRSPSQMPESVMPKGLGIGLVNGHFFDGKIDEEVLHLRLGDVLVFYTDGFSEAMNPAKELYGDAPLAEKVAEVGRHKANEILQLISADVHGFMAGAEQHDDMTMIVVKMTGTALSTTGLILEPHYAGEPL